MGIQSGGFLPPDQIGKTLSGTGDWRRMAYTPGLGSSGQREEGRVASQPGRDVEGEGAAVWIGVMEGTPARWVPWEGAGQGVVGTEEPH